MSVRSHKDARIGEEILPYEMGYLPEFFQKKSEVELNDSPENREKGLRLMREMARKDKHFEGLTLDDDILLQYLRCRKFNINRAFSQLRNLLILKKKIPHLFTDFSFEKVALTSRNRMMTLLPWRCQDGCAIIFLQLDHWKPEMIPFEEVKSMATIYLLHAIRDPMTQVCGFKVIVDAKCSSIKLLRHVTPTNAYLFYYIPMDCSPSRFKAFHIINDSLPFKAAFFLLKPFLSAKLKQRIFFHSKPDDIFNYFPRCVLPTEYGGTLENFDKHDWFRNASSPQRKSSLGGGGSGLHI